MMCSSSNDNKSKMTQDDDTQQIELLRWIIIHNSKIYFPTARLFLQYFTVIPHNYIAS